MRCTAALLVLAGHTRFFLIPRFPALGSLSVLGFLGVEIFFVLSGFLIGAILIRSINPGSPPRALFVFWIRRWFRTLPNYYLFLLVNVALGTAITGSSGGLWSYGFFLQNLAWPCGVFFNESWSLAVEEWFYLGYPILLWAASRYVGEKGFAVVVTLGAVFLFSTASRIAAVAAGDPSWDDGIRKVVIYRMDALMIGVFGAALKEWAPSLWTRSGKAGVFAGLLLSPIVLGGYFAFSLDSSFFSRTFLFTVTSLCAFSFLPALDAWREARGRLATTVRSLSLWSYSLYLCNLPVHAVMTSVFGDPRHAPTPPATPLLVALAVLFVTLSITIAALNYRCFERPMMNLRERFE